MLGKTYERENCSAARALEIVGERWSLLIMREAMFAGSTRFTEFQRSLGIAPNVLSTRLENFVAAGLMRTRKMDGERPAHEYVLTEKGRDLQGVIIALSQWGDRWEAPLGPPIIYRHEACGGRIHQSLGCHNCSGPIEPERIVARPGPGTLPS